jgi:hypothetical protein
MKSKKNEKDYSTVTSVEIWRKVSDISNHAQKSTYILRYLLKEK